MKSIIVVVLMLVATASTSVADSSDAGALRKTCADAMNADPGFAKDVIKLALVKEARDVPSLCKDADTVRTHEEAAEHVAKNEQHVIIAYAAMWVIAAAFVIFLWRRQQGLREEIVQLRKELDAATKEPAK